MSDTDTGAPQHVVPNLLPIAGRNLLPIIAPSDSATHYELCVPLRHPSSNGCAV